jgi:hypothetical protein
VCLCWRPVLLEDLDRAKQPIDQEVLTLPAEGGQLRIIAREPLAVVQRQRNNRHAGQRFRRWCRARRQGRQKRLRFVQAGARLGHFSLGHLG